MLILRVYEVYLELLINFSVLNSISIFFNLYSVNVR